MVTANFMTKKIQLTQGFEAIVDDEDFEMLNKFKWHVTGNKQRTGPYAVRMIQLSEINKDKGRRVKKNIYMHRVVMDCPKNRVIDHINDIGLDNRKSNLRICTNLQNLTNQKSRQNGSSKYKGVSWVMRDCIWRAYISDPKTSKNKAIGTYRDEILAAKAFDKWAIKLHGEFAHLNFPKGKDAKT